MIKFSLPDYHNGFLLVIILATSHWWLVAALLLLLLCSAAIELNDCEIVAREAFLDSVIVDPWSPRDISVHSSQCRRAS